VASAMAHLICLQREHELFIFPPSGDYARRPDSRKHVYQHRNRYLAAAGIAIACQKAWVVVRRLFCGRWALPDKGREAQAASCRALPSPHSCVRALAASSSSLPKSHLHQPSLPITHPPFLPSRPGPAAFTSLTDGHFFQFEAVSPRPPRERPHRWPSPAKSIPPRSLPAPSRPDSPSHTHTTHATHPIRASVLQKTHTRRYPALHRSVLDIQPPWRSAR
jgi:hypothetical protein